MVDPQPIQYNPDGTIKVPTAKPSSSPTVAPPLNGATVRAGLQGSSSAADMANALGLTSTGTSTTSDASDPNLLWQKRTPRKGAGSAAAADSGYGQFDTQGNYTAGDDIIKRSDAQAKIFSSDSYRESVAKQMVAAGLLDPTQINDLGAIQKAWNQVVSQSASFYQAGNPRTPEEVIALINIQKKHAAATYPRTVTADSTTTQDFGTDGPSRVRAALQQTLGRDPTPSEMTTYQAGLNAAAQANPQQSHSVQTQDGQGNTVTNTTNSGGIDPTEVLGQMAVTDPDYGAYQASTTYMNALKQAIGAFV